MKLKICLCIIFLTSLSSPLLSQALRTSSMAGITLSVKDEDNSFNPYDMAGNLSFLYLDEANSWLKINPSYNSDWGDYKRAMDAKRTDLYGLNFTGLKKLGTEGTFIGNVTYLYDARADVNHSIKYNTYRGEAFFINDSSSGNINYSGPAVKFGYSFELIPDLYLGASAGYKILRGLKEVYSQSSTTLRDVDGSVGLTYRITDGLYLSGAGHYYNSQEKITAASSNPVDVEIYNYRGETFRILDRDMSITDKIKEDGYTLSSQAYFKPGDRAEAGINFTYSNDKQRLLFEKNISGGTDSDYEDGYSFFNDFRIEAKGRYDLTSNFTVGIKGFYGNNSCWSKISTRNLLIWEWKFKAAGAGIGGTYNFSSLFSLSLEYDYSNVNGDSSKYIDNRYSTVTSGDHIIRVGGEYRLFENLFLRGGYAAGRIQNDIVYGGSNINYNLATFGIGLNLFSTFSIDFLLEYNNYKPKQLDFSRSKLNGLVSVKLLNI